MTRKERILAQLHGQPVDRIPMFGGWNLGAANLAQMARMELGEFMKDPFAGMIAANQRLGVDAITTCPIVPQSEEEMRQGSVEEHRFEHCTPEDLLERAEKTPDEEGKLLADFDFDKSKQGYLDWYRQFLPRLGGIEALPTHWECIANFQLYFQYGYKAFLEACGLYPDEVEKIFWADSVVTRARNQALAAVFRELNLIPMIFCGHDICDNKAPMVSPRFLKQRYWKHARYSIEPLLEAGIQLFHHCDGNIMPLIDDILDIGFSGFQGFQYECGVDPRVIRAKKTKTGATPKFLTGLSVTRTLPYGTEQDVRDEVDYFLECTEGGKGMFLFTSNVTGVEVPPQNVCAAYDYLKTISPEQWQSKGITRWPWFEKEAKENPSP
ncbi:hypothetical protein QPK87_07480 [Kamptonema cortianum]|nr:hypothetical protein [Oscillatoria laete-virens]MDK3156416.1 hypothetical protein [Kamptonema cortianum]MDL5046274.1 hypothetical protein [Oscillatoria amoena NRMC-F 0135]MDL5053905.1 hypothetical protein [Oscillatoria laete-virens NRMC-F 0139]